MRCLSTFFFIFSLVLFASLNDARNDPEEYWRNVMKDDPMPKTIQDALIEDSFASSDKGNKIGRFTKNFDTKPNLIIYCSHVMYNQKDHELTSSNMN
ncbi:Organ specific protein [Artemisia annua]|uniref:Organ specific protein n=1 Tax=Artemisia annua TaxID=35608 RepID=A0A2U1P7T3_ARTAN|nr:Organ specific protein [Artemisia annua]